MVSPLRVKTNRSLGSTRSDDTTTLYVSTDGESRFPEDIVAELTGAEVSFLDLSESGIDRNLPDGWRRLCADDYFDADGFRRDFVRFLEEWPTKQIWKGKSFEQLFRRPSGYSVWWTTIGAARTPRQAPVTGLKSLWIADRVLQNLGVSNVYIDCRNSALARALVSQCCASGKPVRSLHEPELNHRHARALPWLVTQISVLASRPFRVIPLSILVRLFSPPLRRESRQMRDRPAVFFRPSISRNVLFENGVTSVPFWKEFSKEFERRIPEGRQRFMPNRDFKGENGLVRWLRHSGAEMLKAFKGAVPLLQCHTGMTSWVTALPTQIVALIRLLRVERSPEYAASFKFAGADVSILYHDRVRRAVAGIAEWERNVGAVSAGLRRVGNVRALVALSEFYSGPMSGMAAAQKLGIPVVGVQHGTVSPTHLVYTVPHGHMQGAPVPDFFAVYGEHTKEIVSRIGAYPARRVWVTGAFRLDHLVSSPPDQVDARARLTLEKKKHVLLVTTQTRHWFPRVVQAVLHAASTRDDCIVCVKVHFGDRHRMTLYRDLARNIGVTAVRFYEDQFDDLLAACDVLISASSTTILEACLLNRPTICANFSKEADRYPYVSEGASIPARTAEEMQDALEHALTKRTQYGPATRAHEFLRRHVGPTVDGQGAAVLVDHIKHLLDQAPARHSVECQSLASQTTAE